MNPFLVGLILPWLTAILVSHLQIYAVLVNWTSLVFGILVSIFCSLIMWTIQMEESMIHEANFKESIKMLVVQKTKEIEIDDPNKEQETESSVIGAARR